MDSPTSLEEEEKLARIRHRRSIRKFGECSKQAPQSGPERGITAVSLIAFPMIWTHEEKKKQAEAAKAKKAGTVKPTKKYVPINDRRNPYSIRSEEKRRQRRPLSDKAQELLDYCQSHLPAEKRRQRRPLSDKAQKQKLK